MMERKFTDEDIIKALDFCLNNETIRCHKCPYRKTVRCMGALMKDALTLINRQRAEIERVKEENRRMKKYYFTHDYHECHNEAIKEFAERVKEIKVKYWLPLLGLHTKTEIENYVDDILLQMRDGIDRLVKKMTVQSNDK